MWFPPKDKNAGGRAQPEQPPHHRVQFMPIDIFLSHVLVEQLWHRRRRHAPEGLPGTRWRHATMVS